MCFIYSFQKRSYLFIFALTFYIFLGFDELSDTSTLVGDMDRADEDLTPQPVILEENVENEEGDQVES